MMGIEPTTFALNFDMTTFKYRKAMSFHSTPPASNTKM